MEYIILSLGSNLGDRQQHLERACQLLEGRGIAIQQRSSVYETQPYGISEQPNFLNQVIVVETNQSSEELMRTCLEIEEEMGRVRGEKNGPRIIDIDLLFYRDEMANSDNLKLPHPGIVARRFILAPLAEIAGGFVHPGLRKSLSQLLDECPDQLIVKPYN